MQLKDNVAEALIGLAVLLVGGWFVAYFYTHTEGTQRDGYELVAKFPSASGIAVGSDVRVSGIKIGSVSEQSLDPQTYQAKLQLTIDKAVQLPIDTIAKISSEGLLGGNFVALSPGGEADYLKAGDEIEQTQGSVDLIDLVGRAIYNTGGESKSDASASDSNAAPQP
jgi:phospholipid/cholesterol/gamma-HCH transport system substrate-binding protein